MSNCTPCTGALNSSGYGSAYLRGRRVGAHVAAYARANNTSDQELQGKVVMHTCDNRQCINPDHLVLGTQSTNLKDMVKRGRQNLTVRYGEFANHKLTDADVEYIRAHYVRGLNQTNRGNAVELAARFNVTRNLIQKIAQGVTRVRGTICESTTAV